MRFKFVILISFSFVVKSSFDVTVLIVTGSGIFLVLELLEVPFRRESMSRNVRHYVRT